MYIYADALLKAHPFFAFRLFFGGIIGDILVKRFKNVNYYSILSCMLDSIFYLCR